ncbi:helix-turn-helix domain-containing protein [Shouchella lonarensis]|uniref:Helix-turn-helix n=1 Tax=Shouchella lonarensis TaxID=1464122 RepID=A0A1G6IKU4_9BACI|nr:helix-turn-helix transcriptional regulator [Shouchella lonarensis]SDC07084.1 Helix-turn-helix [Shouchella lonarensis]
MQNMSYGSFIATHRKKSGYKTITSLSTASGIHKGTLSNIEKEKRKPSLEAVKTLSTLLTTTTYKELMAVCGYWDMTEEYKETSKRNAERFRIEFDQLTDEEILKMPFAHQGKALSEEQKKIFIKELRKAFEKAVSEKPNLDDSQ